MFVVVVVCSSKFETMRMREERMVLAGQRRREWVGVVVHVNGGSGGCCA